MAASSSMGSAALASLFPFLLFLFGHYFSLSFLFADFLLGDRAPDVDGYYLYDPVGGGGGSSWWVSVPRRAGDIFVAQVMAVSLLSYVLLCLSTAAAVHSASSAHVLPSGIFMSSFYKARALWRQPPSPAARLYFAFLLLGYLLSLLAVFAATLAAAAAGDDLSLGTWRLLLSLLALLAVLYSGILRLSVGQLQGSAAASDDDGGHMTEALARAPWSTALALMEEAKLQRFFLFFFSVVVVHGALLLTRELCVIGRGSSTSVMPPVLMGTVWVLGTCELFRYLGVLLQVC